MCDVENSDEPVSISQSNDANRDDDDDDKDQRTTETDGEYQNESSLCLTVPSRLDAAGTTAA